MAPHISIRDLGPIGRADLELKPLTIFVGPNNSGKSYAALTIYSLNRSIGEPEPYDRPFSTRRWQGITGLRGRSGEEWDRVRTLLKNSMGGPDGRLLEQANPRTLPAELHELVLEESVALTEPLSRSVDYELQRCFGVTLDDLGRRDRKTDRGEFEIHLKDDSTGFRWTTQCQNDELVTTDWNSEVSSGEIRWDLSRFAPLRLTRTGTVFVIPDGGIFCLFDEWLLGYGSLPASQQVRNFTGTQDTGKFDSRRGFSGLDRTHERSQAAGGNHRLDSIPVTSRPEG